MASVCAVPAGVARSRALVYARAHDALSYCQRPRRDRLCRAPRLRLLPAISRPGALSAVHGAAWLLLRRDGVIHHRRRARAAAHRHRGLRRADHPVRERWRGHRRPPGLAAASAGGQSAAVRPGSVFHAEQPAAVAHAGEAFLRQRRVRRGRLEIPWPVDRRLVARVVYRASDRRGSACRVAVAASLKTSPRKINAGPPESCAANADSAPNVPSTVRISREAFSTTATGVLAGLPALINAREMAGASPAPM